MKRMISLFMALTLLLTLCACGAKEMPGAEDPVLSPEAVPTEAPAAPEEPEVPEEALPEPEEAPAAGETLGVTLQNGFLAAAQPGMSAMEAAAAVMESPALSFAPVSMEVEPGLLTGFGNTEITGFEEGAMFAPMIGAIPFVGYVFRLDGQADSHAFADRLKENADPRWNICTEADETVIALSGDLVFFVMCPYSMEE